jgi:hypothetical protein
MKKKILLVFPIFQAVYPRAFGSFAQILIAAGRQQDYLFGVCVHERQSLVAAMNQVAERMVAEDWAACIIFDDDCFPPYDVVPRLLTRCFDEGHQFVSATGVMRGYPFTTTVARYYDEGISAVLKDDGRLDHLAGFEWLDDLPHELVDVDFCGVPAAIVHRDVFLKIAPPHFGDQDDKGVQITHDVYFCRKLKAAGIPVKVDGTIRCGHMAEAPIITFENRAGARGEPAREQ